MKGFLLLFTGLGLLGSSLYFQQTEKTNFKKIKGTHDVLQAELKTVEDDLDFLNQHNTQLNFLIKKGWFVAQNRLIGAEAIHQATNHLNAIRFRIEPETIKDIEGEYSFKISKIVIEVDALLDTDIYDFATHLSKNFPGILRLLKFSLSRNEPLNEFTLRQHKRPNFVVGELIYEWVAMGGKSHEE